MQKTVISLDKSTVLLGEAITFSVRSEHTTNYSQFQIDIFTCGVPNPDQVWASGSATANAVTDTNYMRIDTSQLRAGIFEVKLVGFHTPKIPATNPAHLQLIGGQDFPRTFINIIHVEGNKLQQDELLCIVEAKETALEDGFLSGIDVPNTNAEKQSQYCVFVFVVGAKITKRLRFDRWEVIPFRGMDERDSFEIVHEFLRDCTGLRFTFPYSSEILQLSREGKPVCVAHFPMIVTDSMESARDYCRHRCFLLGQALSAHRGATSELICTVVYDRGKDHARLFTEGTIYRGNLLGGSLAGESAERIEASIIAMSKSSLMRYLYLLYSYARSEEVLDYQYLRYWQFLEAVSETKNFLEDAELRDFKGNPIRDAGGIAFKIAGAKHQVYELIKSHKLEGGLSESNAYFSDGIQVQHSLFEMVTFWYAMRNAAAHFGHFLPDDAVQKEKFRYYAKCLEVRKLVGPTGYDYILDDLKSTANLVLLRETNSFRP